MRHAIAPIATHYRVYVEHWYMEIATAREQLSDPIFEGDATRHQTLASQEIFLEIDEQEC
jgi:hypothetical protein